MNETVEREQIYKLILRAGDIPLNSIVSKKTGTYTYTIIDKVKIYGVNNNDGSKISCKEITADENCRFLTNENGSVNAVGVDTELCWHVDNYQLLEFLQYGSEELDQ